MAVGAREVAFQDLGVQEFRVAGPDRVDEIAEVVAAAVELLHQLALRVEGGPIV